MKRTALYPLMLLLAAALLLPLHVLAAGHTVTISSQTQVSCNGGSNGSATAAVSGGVGPFSYAWIPSGGTNATATGLLAGTYTVTATDNSDMSTATATVTITQPAALVVSLPSSTQMCQGSAITLSPTVTGGTPGYTYSWAPNTAIASVTAPNATVSPTATITYSVVVTDVNNCSATASINVIVHLNPNVAATPDPAYNCSGSGVQLLATGAVSYSWTPSTGLTSNTSASPTAIPGTTTTYTVTGVDANGCYGTDAVTVNAVSSITTSAGPASSTICQGSSTTLTASGANSYTWFPATGLSATTGAIVLASPTISTSYTITGTAGSCTSTTTVSITVNPTPPAPTASSNSPVCNGSTLNLFASTTAGATYMWMGPNGYTSTLQNPTFTATPAAAGTYTVVATLNGCQSPAATTTVVVNTVVATASSTNATCYGACDGTATVSATGGSSPYSYLWSPTSATTLTATGLCAGTYTVIVTDMNGCMATSSTTISQPAQLSSSASSTAASCAICNGTATGSITGGTPPYTYTWNTTPAQTSASATALCPGTYTLMVTDANGCTDTPTVTVTSSSSITATISSTDATCYGACNGTATVAISGGTAPYTYLWAPAGGTTASLSGLCAGTYTVTVTDNMGCVATATVTINQPPQLTSTGNTTNVTCSSNCDGMATVNPAGGVPPYAYLWMPGNYTTQTVSNLCPGTYTVTVTDANGTCNTVSNLSINVTPFSVSTSTTMASCAGSDGTATAIPSGGNPPFVYSWSPTGQTVTVATLLSAGSYTVSVVDANGCLVTDVATVLDSCGSVWPGDADEDLTVDNNDVLAIGFAYGYTGPARQNASLSWIPQPAMDWTTTLTSGTNCKYTDTNGDGVIDSNDTLAITLNYGNTHPFRFPAPSPAGANPMLYLVANVDSAGPQAVVTVDVMMGTTAMPIDSIYGVAFSLNFDPALVDTALTTMDYTGSWIGTQGVNMLPFSKNINTAGRVDVTVVGTDHVNRNGSGRIATMKIVTTDNLSGIVDLEIEVTDVNAMRLSGNQVPLGTAGDTIVVDPNGIVSIELERYVSLYPNPASSAATLMLPAALTENVRIIDITGRTMMSIDHPSTVTHIDLSALAAGTYQVMIQTTQGNIYRKLNVIR